MINRRDLITILGAGATAAQIDAFQHGVHAIQSAPKEYKLRFFSEAENRLLEEVAEMILPADERSPGARAAKVSFYVDLVAASSPVETQQEWRSRLASFDQAGGAPFLQLAVEDRAALLDRLAGSEGNPSSPPELFFARMKRATLLGYYTSEIGVRQELQRKSPEVLDHFTGACQHEPGTHSGLTP
ncbi:MAG: gluconate 2-dehydrogenase subunit 3 family protein [Acidobacteriia bacterium]|nr:gluconate 2-dehydrogenase subunit 3 family protein [Terriglobia bacterium]